MEKQKFVDEMMLRKCHEVYGPRIEITYHGEVCGWRIDIFEGGYIDHPKLVLRINQGLPTRSAAIKKLYKRALRKKVKK